MSQVMESSGCIAGSNILKPLLFEVQNYGELCGIDKDKSEAFFWHYEAVGWVLPNGGIISNWQAKLRQWNVQNRVYDKRQKDRDEARAKALTPVKNGDILIEGEWWNDYRWYCEQVQESPVRAARIESRKYNEKAYFRFPISK